LQIRLTIVLIKKAKNAGRIIVEFVLPIKRLFVN